MQYRTKIDLGVAAVTVLTGAFFAYHASQISAGDGFGVGPNIVPLYLSFGIIALGLLVGLSSLLLTRSRKVDSAAEGETAVVDTNEKFGFRDSDLKRVVLVVAMGALYIFLFHAFGYLLSTLIALALMLVVFGNRNLITIAVLAVVGAAVYEFVFIGLMGLHDPSGAYFDFKEWVGWDELKRSLGLL